MKIRCIFCVKSFSLYYFQYKTKYRVYTNYYKFIIFEISGINLVHMPAVSENFICFLKLLVIQFFISYTCFLFYSLKFEIFLHESSG